MTNRSTWLLTAMGMVLGLASKALAADLAVTCAPNTARIQKFEVFELTFQHPGVYRDPFFDVSIDVVFTSPSGEVFKVGGFHYGSLEKAKIVFERPAAAKNRAAVKYEFDKSDTWKARFAPNEVGRWRWSYTFANNKGGKAIGTGQFMCVAGRKPNPGFVRHDPRNAYRWIFDDGTPFIPIGLQECVGDGQGLGTVLASMSMEGPFRLDRKPTWPAPLPGAMYKPGPAMNPQNADVYFRRYTRCGFNLFRYSQENCSFALNRNLDRYLVQEAIMTDELIQHVRKYKMRVMYGIFGFQNVFNNHPEDAVAMEKVKRFIKYSVDRWGAYIDIWELLNEQNAKDEWYAITVPYLKSIDPYHHPVATSWERPQLEGIDVSAPHWYCGRNDLNCDADTTAAARQWKRFDKPVIVGEQGNTSNPNPTSRPAGVGGVWDITSAQRMRIRNWTALFNEISFVFWNTSYAKDGHYMNIWLGPKEREYVRAMQDFAYCLGGDVRMSKVEVSQRQNVRAWALASERRAGVYLHHFRDHRDAVRGLTITLDVPRAAKGYWYNTETAGIPLKIVLPAGRQTIDVPEFVVDLALLITPDGPPDIDKDGIPNDVDDDNDNDGVPNAKDAFPLEPEEWADRDGDMIGDNLDADKDGDGIGDDDNHNGIPDFQEMDIDGDGVPRANAVPWDAFPNDPKEWKDTDGDGIGDNADTDKDGDGFSDEEERIARTDPLNKLSFPKDKGDPDWDEKADSGTDIQPPNLLLASATADGAERSSKVAIDPSGALFVDGRKLFPVGLTMPPPPDGKTPDGKDAYRALHEAGVRFIRTGPTGTGWDDAAIATERKYQDAAARAGLKCMVYLHDLASLRENDAKREVMLRKIVTRFRDHPGMGVWKGADEPDWGKIPVANVERVYRIVTELDPKHPVWIVQAPRGTVQSLRAYDGGYDITGMDVYPVSYPPGVHSIGVNKEISMVGDFTKMMQEVAGQKPLWMTLQIAFSGVVKPGKTLRFPTFEQERFMSYEAIINGARGLIYFGGHLPQTFNQRDSELGWNWTFWERVLRPLLEELGPSSPLAAALLAPDFPRPIKVEGEGIEFCIRQPGADVFIIACKREGKTIQAQFTGLPPETGDIEVMFESPRRVKAANGAFTDWFGPFDVHVYRFQLRK